MSLEETAVWQRLCQPGWGVRKNAGPLAFVSDHLFDPLAEVGRLKGAHLFK